MELVFKTNDYLLAWYLLFKPSTDTEFQKIKLKLWKNYTEEYKKIEKDNVKIMQDTDNFIPNNDLIYDKIFETDYFKKYKTKTIILATGAKPRSLNIPGEAEYVGKGVHYCSTCDGPFYKGLDVAVIGGGNSGVEAALDMSGIAKNVTLIEFMPELKADKVLQEKLAQRENVNVILNSATTEVLGTEFVENLKYKNRATNEEKTLKLDGIFIEVGLSPSSEIVKDLVELNKVGEIVINPLNNETSVEGIFAAGDVTSIKQKQIIVAMGEGAKAALGAFEYLITKY